MDFDVPRILLNPFLWCALSGVFWGAAISRATTSVSGKTDAERARTIKWVLVCLNASFALVFILLGFLLSDASRIFDGRLLLFLGAASGFFALLFRFRRSFGAVAFSLLVAIVLVVFLFVRSLVGFTGETEIAQVQVLGVENGAMKLELAVPGQDPQIISMDGEYFAPIVKVVVFDDFFVFLGTTTWYRFEGLTSFSTEQQDGRRVLRQADTDYYLPRPEGISETVYGFVERNEQSMPGIKSAQIEIDAKRARPLRSYAVRIQNDGGVQIVDTE